MRILMLNHNVRGRSTYFRAFHLGRWLVRAGHTVTLLTLSPTRRVRFAESMEQGVRVVETPDLLFGSLRSGWDPVGALRRATYLRRQRFDLVHAFDCRPAVLLPAMVQKWLHARVLVMDWADWWGRGGAIRQRHGVLNTLFAPVETFLEERFRKYADGLTLTSSSLFQRAGALGLADTRRLYLASGSSVDLIQPTDRTQARLELGLDPTEPVVLYSGFVHYDIDLALRAFERVLGRCPTARLVLVGTQPKSLNPAIRRLGIGHRVTQFGPQLYSRMPQFFGAADVLLLPLRRTVCNEGRDPIRLGDYLAAGRPIVTSPVGDVTRVFRDAPCGILAESDPEAYAAAILRVFEDPNAAEAMGRAARAFAQEHCSWQVAATKVEQFYQHILDGKHRKPAPADTPLGAIP